MSPSLWSLMAAHPGQALNAVALFLALAGAWLLVATRVRAEQAIIARLRPTAAHERLNLFFYCFGAANLAVALLASFISTQV